MPLGFRVNRKKQSTVYIILYGAVLRCPRLMIVRVPRLIIVPDLFPLPGGGALAPEGGLGRGSGGPPRSEGGRSPEGGGQGGDGRGVPPGRGGFDLPPRQKLDTLNTRQISPFYSKLDSNIHVISYTLSGTRKSHGNCVVLCWHDLHACRVAAHSSAWIIAVRVISQVRESHTDRE